MLVGFMGAMGSGKTTAANFMINEYGYVEKAFADPLKRACKELFLFTDDQLYGTQAQKEEADNRWFGCSARTAMQFVGTDLFRNQLNAIMPGIKNNIWVHHFKLWYQNHIKILDNPPVVISDIRFQNEADIIKKMGGIIIRIDRPNGFHPPQKRISNYDICMYYFMIPFGFFVCIYKYLCWNPTCIIILIALYIVYLIILKFSGMGSAHSSETEYLKITPDYVITNDGTLINLYNQINSRLEEHNLSWTAEQLR
jgi:hypothetical protein